MGKIFIIGISLAMAIVLYVLLCVAQVYIADNAEDDILFDDEPYLHFLAGLNSESLNSFFGRVDYDGFDEVRNRYIPEKNCHIKILNYLYGKKNCAYAGNVKKITLYTSDLKEIERDSNWQIEESIYFSEIGDSIIANSYYKGKLYLQWFAIYNGNLLEKQFVRNTDEEEFNERNYYYDGDELIKVVYRYNSFDTTKTLNYYGGNGLMKTVHPDSFFTTAIESYFQDFRQKKQTLNAYFDLYSYADSPAGRILNVTLIPYESQWTWYYDDSNRLVEKSNKAVFDSSRYSDMLERNFSFHQSRYFDMLRHFFLQRKYIYLYDNDALAKVEIFGQTNKRIGTLRFKNSKTKRRWDYASSRLRLSEEYEYDDKNRLRKTVANLRDYPYMGKDNRVVLFDSLSNIISDSLFSMDKLAFLRKGNYTDVKKKRYSSEGRLESIEHIVRRFERKIPLVGFGFTASEHKSESFVYDIKYDSIGNPDRITRKHFENNQLRNHTAFKLSYEYK